MKNEKTADLKGGNVTVKNTQRDFGFIRSSKVEARATNHRDRENENSRNKSQIGFTLIELVIVLVAIGTLTAFAASRLSGFSDQVDRRALADSIVTAGQRVMLSNNLSISDVEQCSAWDAYGSELIEFVDSELLTSDASYDNDDNISKDYTQSVSLPGSGSGCEVDV